MSDETFFVRAIVTVASWEPRWEPSVQALLNENPGASLHILFSSRYKEWTQGARLEMIRRAQLSDRCVDEMELDFEHSGSAWRGIAAFCERLAQAGVGSVVLDGTTMPRELTWFLLHATGALNLETDYAYVPAGSYGEWLSKESLQPRLVLKRSGILYPDKPTCVVAMSGFDLGRLNQMLSFFEPARSVIARQIGDSYGNISRNTPQLSEYARHAEIFDFDGFDLSGKAHSALKDRIAPLLEDNNVLLASLGPKLAAVTAFEITEDLPDVALVYIPTSSYNRDYSKGEDMTRRVVRRVRRRDELRAQS
jgi:hypothetical protein